MTLLRLPARLLLSEGLALGLVLTSWTSTAKSAPGRTIRCRGESRGSGRYLAGWFSVGQARCPKQINRGGTHFAWGRLCFARHVCHHVSRVKLPCGLSHYASRVMLPCGPSRLVWLYPAARGQRWWQAAEERSEEQHSENKSRLKPHQCRQKPESGRVRAGA